MDHSHTLYFNFLAFFSAKPTKNLNSQGIKNILLFTHDKKIYNNLNICISLKGNDLPQARLYPLPPRLLLISRSHCFLESFPVSKNPQCSSLSKSSLRLRRPSLISSLRGDFVANLGQECGRLSDTGRPEGGIISNYFQELVTRF